MQPTGVPGKFEVNEESAERIAHYGQSMWLDYIRRDSSPPAN